MIHGRSDFHTSLVDGRRSETGARAGMVPAESSWCLSAGEVQSSAGCQTFKNRMRQAMEISEAPISTIQGLMKFEIRNCGIAKETPQTRIAGQIAIMPRQPAKAQISQNGTMSEKNGNCRPTIAPSKKGSMPVTLDRPAIGVPRAP